MSSWVLPKPRLAGAGWPGRTGANIAGVALADVAVAGSGCVSAGGYWGEGAAARMGAR